MNLPPAHVLSFDCSNLPEEGDLTRLEAAASEICCIVLATRTGDVEAKARMMPATYPSDTCMPDQHMTPCLQFPILHLQEAAEASFGSPILYAVLHFANLVGGRIDPHQFMSGVC